MNRLTQQFRLEGAHLSWAAACIAIVVALAGAMNASKIDNLLRVVAAGQDARLAAISQDAEQLQTFSRNVRKASFTPEPEIIIAYGGQVQSYKQLTPGSRLTIGHSDTPGSSQVRTFHVVSARKIEPTIELSPGTMNGGSDLVLVSGRLVDSEESAVVQILVTVKDQKPLTNALLDQRSL